MAKIVLYTLTTDGCIPDCILDGGYYSIINDKQSPQDYTLLGISKNISVSPLPENILKIIDSQDELSTYLTLILPNTEELEVETTSEVETENGVETIVTTEISIVPTNIQEKVDYIFNLLGKYS